MKSLIGLLALALSFTAHAESKKVYQASLSCAIVTFDPIPSKDSTHKLMWKDLTINEGEEVELFRTATASYVIYLDQHEKKYDPKDSSLFMFIKTLDGQKTIADVSAFWPKQRSRGRMVGLGRLEIQTDFAEPNVHTNFMCDNRLMKETKR